MTELSQHSRLTRTASLIAGMAALIVVLVAPLSSVLGFASSPQAAHGCCTPEKKSKAAQDRAQEHCEHGLMSTAQGDTTQHSCGCHLMPQDAAVPGEVVALTSSTLSFGPAVAAPNNLQVDIPLAREPDEAKPTYALHLPAASQPLYLLHGVLLL